jgi:pimeloyl-ACP methyl ester carboxylesterase
LTGPPSELAVVCASGGRAAELPGTWGSSVELLVRELAPRFPAVRFAELRYRVRSWNRLDRCIEDLSDAVVATGGERTVLVGFSMGGAVAVATAAETSVVGVLGLAPWLPDGLDVSTLRGRRLDVLHGALDRWLPGIPGVSPASSRRGFERARNLGVPGSYAVIPGAVHGLALRASWGTLIPLPRARRWIELVEDRLAAYA